MNTVRHITIDIEQTQGTEGEHVATWTFTSNGHMVSVSRENELVEIFDIIDFCGGEDVVTADELISTCEIWLECEQSFED